jgi:chromosome segregation ATPase
LPQLRDAVARDRDSSAKEAKAVGRLVEEMTAEVAGLKDKVTCLKGEVAGLKGEVARREGAEATLQRHLSEAKAAVTAAEMNLQEMLEAMSGGKPAPSLRKGLSAEDRKVLAVASLEVKDALQWRDLKGDGHDLAQAEAPGEVTAESSAALMRDLAAILVDVNCSKIAIERFAVGEVSANS